MSSSAAGEQSQALDDIAHNMEKITVATDHNLQLAAHGEESAGVLLSMTERMKKAVHQYRL